MGCSSRAWMEGEPANASGCQRRMTDNAPSVIWNWSDGGQFAAYGSGSIGSPSITSNSRCARPKAKVSSSGPLAAKARRRTGDTDRYRFSSARPCRRAGTGGCSATSRATRRNPSASTTVLNASTVASQANGAPLASRGRSQRLRRRPPVHARMSAPSRRLSKRRSVRPSPKSRSLRAGPHRPRARRAEASARRLRHSKPCALASRVGSIQGMRPSPPLSVPCTVPGKRNPISPPWAASPAASGGIAVNGSPHSAALTVQSPVKPSSAERLPAMDHGAAPTSYANTIAWSAATGPPTGVSKLKVEPKPETPIGPVTVELPSDRSSNRVGNWSAIALASEPSASAAGAASGSNDSTQFAPSAT